MAEVQEYRDYWVLTEAIPVFEGDKRPLGWLGLDTVPQRTLVLFGGFNEPHLGHCVLFQAPHYPKNGDKLE